MMDRHQRCIGASRLRDALVDGRCRERRLPRFAHDREQMYASLDKLAALEAGGARIFFGHDPEFWATVPQGSTPITF